MYCTLLYSLMTGQTEQLLDPPFHNCFYIVQPGHLAGHPKRLVMLALMPSPQHTLKKSSHEEHAVMSLTPEKGFSIMSTVQF